MHAALATTVYTKQPCNNRLLSITQSFLPALKAVLLKLYECALSHAKFTPGWAGQSLK